jgi:hypothetical protein
MAKNIKSDLSDSPVTSKYLNAENETVKRAVEQIVLMVHAAANRVIEEFEQGRERISDATDHLDGVLASSLNISQAAEIVEIAKIGEELDLYFEKTIHRQIFAAQADDLKGEQVEDLQDQQNDLALRERDLKRREDRLESTIRSRVADMEARLSREGTGSRALLEKALQKAEKVFDQNKITRFAYSALSRLQREFDDGYEVRDVKYLTQIFQETIAPFQKAKMVNDRSGKPIKVVVNSFSESCYQDLFLFFCKYYNELLEKYEEDNEIPNNSEELARIFRSKQKDAEEIITNMSRRK